MGQMGQVGQVGQVPGGPVLIVKSRVSVRQVSDGLVGSGARWVRGLWSGEEQDEAEGG